MTAWQKFFGMMVLAALVAGMSFRSVAAEPEKPGKADVRGSITNVSLANDDAKKLGTLGSIRVEGAKQADTSYDKAVVRITNNTKLEKLVGKERKPAKMEDLKKGIKVQAVFTGPVAESYPVQATASEVLILEDAK